MDPQLTKALAITTNMLDMRVTLRRLLGADYDARIEPLRGKLREVDASKRIRFAMAWCKVVQEAGSEMGTIQIVSALCDVLDEQPVVP